MTTITMGSRVKFIKDGVTCTATVFLITTNIENGRKMAVVELEHECPGNRDTVPFDELTAAPFSQAITFTSVAPGRGKATLNNDGTHTPIEWVAGVSIRSLRAS